MDVIMGRLTVCFLLFGALLSAQRDIPPGSLNQPERLEWFRDQGFGMFIHWSVDSQTGVVISHSLAGADEAYTRRFFEELPKTFNPRKFEPRDWAALAKLAGIKYVVLTTKHHSGFAMWDTKTTDFGIMHTPYKHDLTRSILDAFRAQGIAPGIYFSPDDFSWLWKNKIDIQRGIPGVQPRNNPGLMKLDLAQVQELMGNYGPIDVVFFDGEPEGLRDLAWKMQPKTIVTRGAIQTPELYVPGIPLEGAWEANFTMGTAWQYQPQNEQYKTGGQVIDILVETRAKGGNLLLNIGPKPDGELPIEQEERLREVALWMQVNQECIYNVRPVGDHQRTEYLVHEGEERRHAVRDCEAAAALGARAVARLRVEERAGHAAVRGERVGAERTRPGIPAGGESAADVEAGGGRVAPSRDVHSPAAGQQPVAEPDRAEDHECEAGVHAAEAGDEEREVRRRHEDGVADRNAAGSGEGGLAGSGVRVPQHRGTGRQRPLDSVAAGAFHDSQRSGRFQFESAGPESRWGLRIPRVREASAFDDLRRGQAPAHEMRGSR